MGNNYSSLAPVLAADYESGLSVQQVAVKHGMSYPTAYRYLKQAGVVISAYRPGVRKHKYDYAAIAQGYVDGKNTRELAELFHCDPSQITYALRKQGIKVDRVRHKRSPRREIARRLKREGMSYANIGQHMGISRQRAQRLIAPTPLERRELLTRSKGRCERCGKKGEKLHGHHGNYEGAPSEVLCISCHMKETGNQTTDIQLSVHMWTAAELNRIKETFNMDSVGDVVEYLVSSSHPRKKK